MRRERAHSDRAFTLIELFLAAALVAMILIVSISLLSTGWQTSAQSTAQGSVQAEADRLIERLARELKDSSEQSTGWQVGANPSPADQFYGQPVSRISFSRCTGYDPGLEALEWSPVVTYNFVPPFNGQVGRVTRTENNFTVTVCEQVQTFEIVYDADERMVNVTLVVQRNNPLDAGRAVRAAYTTGVRLRN
jgi:Tfp pilus assembly protein PilV